MELWLQVGRSNALIKQIVEVYVWKTDSVNELMPFWKCINYRRCKNATLNNQLSENHPIEKTSQLTVKRLTCFFKRFFFSYLLPKLHQKNLLALCLIVKKDCVIIDLSISMCLNCFAKFFVYPGRHKNWFCS